jgi:uncharacterized protein DUF3572
MRDSPPQRPQNLAAAEEIALRALTFLASDMERLGRFLALTGLSPQTIRAAAHEPGFLTAVLDHIAADDALIVAFATDSSLDPVRVVEARDALARERGEQWPETP